MKRLCQTAEKVKDIKGHSKSKSRGNPNEEEMHGESSTTEKRLRKQAAGEREPRVAKLYGERNQHVHIDEHC